MEQGCGCLDRFPALFARGRRQLGRSQRNAAFPVSIPCQRPESYRHVTREIFGDKNPVPGKPDWVISTTLRHYRWKECRQNTRDINGKTCDQGQNMTARLWGNTAKKKYLSSLLQYFWSPRQMSWCLLLRYFLKLFSSFFH